MEDGQTIEDTEVLAVVQAKWERYAELADHPKQAVFFYNANVKSWVARCEHDEYGYIHHVLDTKTIDGAIAYLDKWIAWHEDALKQPRRESVASKVNLFDRNTEALYKYAIARGLERAGYIMSTWDVATPESDDPEFVAPTNEVVIVADPISGVGDPHLWLLTINLPSEEVEEEAYKAASAW